MNRALRPTRALAALVGVAIAAAAMTGAVGAQSSGDSSLILYVSPPSSSQLASKPVQLWATNGSGANARRLKVVVPPPGRAFEDARLTRLGDVIYAVRAADGTASNLYLINHRTRATRFLFSVRGLTGFAPSPDGLRFAYGRQLPVAGKPATFVASLNGAHKRQVVAATATASLAWPVSSTLFFVGGEGSCWFCAVSVVRGSQHVMPVPVKNLNGSPVISPHADRVATNDLTGPAGERIYSANGKLLRNLVGEGGDAVWAPDQQRLLLQHPSLRVFDFRTRRVTTFHHGGPVSMDVLDWQSTTQLDS